MLNHIANHNKGSREPRAVWYGDCDRGTTAENCIHMHRVILSSAIHSSLVDHKFYSISHPGDSPTFTHSLSFHLHFRYNTGDDDPIYCQPCGCHMVSLWAHFYTTISIPGFQLTLHKCTVVLYANSQQCIIRFPLIN